MEPTVSVALSGLVKITYFLVLISQGFALGYSVRPPWGGMTVRRHALRKRDCFAVTTDCKPPGTSGTVSFPSFQPGSDGVRINLLECRGDGRGPFPIWSGLWGELQR